MCLNMKKTAQAELYSDDGETMETYECSHSKSASVSVEGIIKLKSQSSGCEWTLSGSISRALKHITLAIPAGT